MKLFFGTIKGYRYVIEIGRAVSVTDAGDSTSYERREADMKVVDNDGNPVLDFSREFSDRWGKYSIEGIKGAMIDEAREDLNN